MVAFEYFSANYILPPQNTTHIRTSYYPGHNSNTNSGKNA